MSNKKNVNNDHARVFDYFFHFLTRMFRTSLNLCVCSIRFDNSIIPNVVGKQKIPKTAELNPTVEKKMVETLYWSAAVG